MKHEIGCSSHHAHPAICQLCPRDLLTPASGVYERKLKAPRDLSTPAPAAYQLKSKAPCSRTDCTALSRIRVDSELLQNWWVKTNASYSTSALLRLVHSPVHAPGNLLG